MNKKLLAMALVSTALVLGGCAQSGLHGQTYSRAEAQKAQVVNYGTVESTTAVVIEGNNQGIIGTGAGALLGAVIGNQVGGGTGRQLATVAGAVGGGLAGNHAEAAITKKQGEELTVRLDNGSRISIVQEVMNGQFTQAGSRVKVLKQGNTYRVTY